MATKVSLAVLPRATLRTFTTPRDSVLRFTTHALDRLLYSSRVRFLISLKTSLC